MAQELDVIELENMVRTPFRSGGVKVVGEDGKPVYMEGPERIPKTHGRKEVYLNTKGIGDIGAKLVGNELKKNTDCLSLWLSGNGITALGAAELAKGLKQNKTLTLLDLHDNKLGNEGAKALAQVLKTNTTLKILNICSSGIGPKLPMALEKHPTLQCLCFEVVTASPLVPHDPWTTSHTQMQTKRGNPGGVRYHPAGYREPELDPFLRFYGEWSRYLPGCLGGGGLRSLLGGG
ncbi:hypothetical protein T484DRAFT_2929114 [Baffinella frigidus]|nr:hypothetical protein T484DRAFT_2929114 [Cryptophyta sp. CCMP2293]